MAISNEHEGVTSISPDGLEEVRNPGLSDEELKSDKGIIAQIERVPVNEGGVWVRNRDGKVLPEKETVDTPVASRLKTFFENFPPGKIDMGEVDKYRTILDLESKTDNQLLDELKDPLTKEWTDERVWGVKYSHYRAILAEIMRRENLKMLGKKQQ